MLVCTTIRENTKCPFMTANGCSYNEGKCNELVEACKGCNRTVEFPSGWYCSSCPEPALKWKSGNCNFASHVSHDTEVKSKTKVNPLKASKRAGRKKR